MLYPNVFTILIALLLLPQVFVNGGIVRELCRKFLEFFKSSKPRRPGPFYDNCNLCTFGPCTPIVWPSSDDNFDGSVDAKKIKDALSARTELDENQKATIANILTERSAPQRTAIAEAFTKQFSGLIIDQLDKKIMYVYRYHMFVQQMSLPLPQSFSKMFKSVFQLIGYNGGDDYKYKEEGHAMLVEMLTTLPKCLMDKVIESYKSLSSNEQLMTKIDNVLESDGKPPEYREVITELAEQKRDTNQLISWKKALRDAYKLKSAVIARRQTEMKEIFSNLFIKSSIPQSIETIVVYENLRHGDKGFQSLLDDIDKYTGGEKEIYKIMVRLFTNKPLYYAKIFENVMKSGKLSGFYGERLLVFMLVGRYDIDLKNIIDAYNLQSKTGLKDDFARWNTNAYGRSFQPIILNILDIASRMS